MSKAFYFRLFLSAVLFGHLPSVLAAHFEVGTAVRQFLVDETAATTEVQVRTPLPLLFSDILEGEADDAHGFLPNLGTDAPQILSVDAVEAARSDFIDRLNRALEWHLGGEPVGARVRDFVLHARDPITPLDTRARADAAMQAPPPPAEILLASGYLDMTISVGAVPGALPLRVSTGLPVLTLPEGVAIDNHVTDLRAETPRSFTRPGQLERSVPLPRSFTGWVAEYVWQGVLHILEGIDHVMLVVAMALGALGAWALVKAVTAFTLGHAVTLVAGFLGYAPQAGWFIPGVEAAIAATIVLAALSSLLGQRHGIVLYAVIGLLHGFGFSFVLANVLGRDAPELAPALAAFTVGIELGQLAIIAVVLAIMAALRFASHPVAEWSRRTVLVALAAVGTWMAVSRIPAVLAA